MSVKLHGTMDRPEPSRWRRSVLATLAVVIPIVAFGGCSEGYDIPAHSMPCPTDGTACPLGMSCQPSTGLCAPTGDVDCEINNEPSQGDMCSKDCIGVEGVSATCGGDQGYRVCTCVGGVFVQCACMPPERWPYDGEVPTAPYCDSITGQPQYLGGETCTTPGLQCASTVEANMGCVCNNNGTINNWLCGTLDTLMIAPGAASCESFGSGKQEVLDDNPCAPEWSLCISRNFNATGTSPRGCICNLEGTNRWWCGAINRWFRAE